MGSELSERTIPPEAGIVGRTVSFTKGCFTGQELVARLDARGNRVPRNLRAVVLPTESGAKAGDQLVRDGAALGELTSVAYSPGAHGLVALAYVRREVEPPATLELGSEEGRVSTATFSADVRELPTAN
jgi:folate-binding protein YgfZ